MTSPLPRLLACFIFAHGSMFGVLAEVYLRLCSSRFVCGTILTSHALSRLSTTACARRILGSDDTCMEMTIPASRSISFCEKSVCDIQAAITEPAVYHSPESQLSGAL
ncbi:uncharacterized protein K489DRAFT_381900 [Dissoconium aciculare CBS 342.82]|uniref:Uncharacterized protein n=1 Tax=Dissoconium aciculare CBS 342.82 TaxID=1314786 RepID=A0A6J3LYY9_9PEZI|nr:uncharacterized protein K489DRAFT_381900 [Dissoconium aciculare CBS 342.82]KAF1820863.1 hypothetical protein K489DRAFT_381900 [Dissoconium aciculare CBS 342.82]